MDFIYSVNKIQIRISKERWFHVTEGHPEMAGLFYDVLTTIAEPEIIYKGNYGELLAVKKLNDKFIIAVYKEPESLSGFLLLHFCQIN